MNSGDTAWVLISSSLVMLMTPALGLFYGGMVQQKNSRLSRLLDVCACHGMAGTFGALATGLFASKAVNAAGADGLFHGNHGLFTAQVAAIGSVWLFTFVSTFLITKLVDKSFGFSVSRREHEIGLDISHKWDDFAEAVPQPKKPQKLSSTL